MLPCLYPQLPALFAICDNALDGRPIIYANDKFYTTSGYRREAIMGASHPFMQEGDPSAAAELLEKVRQTCTSCVLKMAVLRESREPIQLLTALSALRDARGARSFSLSLQLEVDPALPVRGPARKLMRLLKLLPNQTPARIDLMQRR